MADLDKQQEQKSITLVGDRHLQAFKESLQLLAGSVRHFNNKFDPHSFSNKHLKHPVASN